MNGLQKQILVDVFVEGRGLKLVLLDRNLALNSDAAPNYKYVFSPRRVFYSSETSQTVKQVHFTTC